MVRLKTITLRERLQQAKQGPLRPIALLLGGTAAAQFLPVLLAPVQSRLFSPADFGAFALSVSVVTVAALIASGAFAQVVALPKERSEAFALTCGLMQLGALAGVVLALVSLAELMAWPQPVSPRHWFVPVATALTVAFTGMSAWLVREGRFTQVVRGRIGPAVAGVAVTLLLGWLGWGAAGLMAGKLAGLTVGCICFGWETVRTDHRLFATINARTIVGALQINRRAPKFLLPSSLINTVTNQLPVWFLGHLFGAGVLGQYALMNRVLNTPVSLVGASVGEVFKQRSAAEYRETGQCRGSFMMFARGLGAAAILPTLLLVAAGPDLFGWVFGDDWRTAGSYARLLAIFFAFRFAISPLAYVVVVAQKHRLILVLQVLCLLAALIGWAIGAITDSPENALAAFGGLYAGVYVLFLIVSYRLSGRS